MACGAVQLELVSPPAELSFSGPWPALDAVPDLAWYDWIVISSSGGKDSLAAHVQVAELAEKLGVADRIVVVHADLGKSEWPGTVDLVRSHAEKFGHRFEVVRKMHEGQPDTIQDYVRRWGKWPSAAARWCTSAFKRGPIRTLYTALAAETRAQGVTDRPARILSVMGMRAAESPARKKLKAFTHAGGKTCPCETCQSLPREKRKSGPSNGRKRIDEWLPVHSWKTPVVMAFGRTSGLDMHPAYAAGLPRASCMFCVLASRSALVRAAQVFPDEAREHAETEAAVGHTFQNGRSMAAIVAEAAAAGGVPVKVAGWVG